MIRLKNQNSVSNTFNIPFEQAFPQIIYRGLNCPSVLKLDIKKEQNFPYFIQQKKRKKRKKERKEEGRKELFGKK